MSARNHAGPAVDASKRLLLATDFDGTIAPIVFPPEAARIHPVAERFLASCAKVPSIAVAIISGRDCDDVRQRIGDVRAIIAGAHGLECADSAGGRLWTSERSRPELPVALTRDVLRAGLRVEQKKFAVAVHFRGVSADSDVVGPRLLSWADEENLDLFCGRKVIEIRVRGGGKRAALRAIAEHVDANRVVYAGDDLTDFPALAYAAKNGRAIFMENDEREPPDIAQLWRVSTIEDLCYGFARELIDAVPDAVPSLVGRAADTSSPSPFERSVRDWRPDSRVS